MNKKRRKNWIYNIAIVFFLGIMVFSLWNLVPLLMQEHADNETQKEMEQMVEKVEEETQIVTLDPDWEALQAANPEIIGWIYVPDTVINYPIVQGSDNDYYLDHSSLGEANTIGSIFLDANASADLSDFHSIIYGHSVLNSSAMLTQVAQFADADFFEAHPYLYILTPQQTYRCDILALTKTTSDSALYQTWFGDDAQRESYLQLIYSQALHSREVEDLQTQDSIVMLSTCDLDYGLDSEYRILLHARLVPWEGTITYEQ